LTHLGHVSYPVYIQFRKDLEVPSKDVHLVSRQQVPFPVCTLSRISSFFLPPPNAALFSYSSHPTSSPLIIFPIRFSRQNDNVLLGVTLAVNLLFLSSVFRRPRGIPGPETVGSTPKLQHSLPSTFRTLLRRTFGSLSTNHLVLVVYGLMSAPPLPISYGGPARINETSVVPRRIGSFAHQDAEHHFFTIRFFGPGRFSGPS